MTLIMTLGVGKFDDAAEILAILIGFGLLIYAMNSEKMARLNKNIPSSKAWNIVAWMIFGFGIGCFLLKSPIAGFITGLILAFVATKFKIYTGSLTTILVSAWIFNILEALGTSYMFMDKIILIYSPVSWMENLWKILIMTFVVMGYGIFNYRGEKNLRIIWEYINDKTNTMKKKEEEEKKQEEAKQTAQPDSQPQPTFETEEEEPMSKAFFQPARKKSSLIEKLLQRVKF